MAYECKKCRYEVFTIADLQNHIYDSHDNQVTVSTVKDEWAIKI